MRKYELCLVYEPDLKEEELEKLIKVFEAEIEKAKGKIVKTTVWGKKKLAYEIKKFTEGVYYLFNIELPEEAVAPLSNKLRIEDAVMRFLLLKDEKKHPIQKSLEDKGGEEKINVGKKLK